MRIIALNPLMKPRFILKPLNLLMLAWKIRAGKLQLLNSRWDRSDYSRFCGLQETDPYRKTDYRA